MKKDKALVPIRVVITVCVALGWWGILYPELALTPDTYRVVCEESAADVEKSSELAEIAAMSDWTLDNNIYETVLEAEKGQLRFRSRLWMNMTALYEQGRGRNGSGK